MAPRPFYILLMEDDDGDDYVPDMSREIVYCHLVSIIGHLEEYT